MSDENAVHVSIGSATLKEIKEGGKYYVGLPEFEFYHELRFPTLRVHPGLVQELDRATVEKYLDHVLASAKRRWLEDLYGTGQEN